jgi:hypothetical protein
MIGVIEFYGVGEPYGEFSNFAPFPILVRGKRWPTSEHFFQAQKFAGTTHEEVRRARKPLLAARMGRDRERPLRRDWEAVEDEVMREALRAKFTQHADLRALLLGTGDGRLVDTPATTATGATVAMAAEPARRAADAPARGAAGCGFAVILRDRMGVPVSAARPSIA